MGGKIIKLSPEDQNFFASRENSLKNIDEKILNEIYPNFSHKNRSERELSVERLYKLIISSFDKNEISKTLYYDGNVSVDYPEMSLVRAQEVLVTNKNIVIKYINNSSDTYEKNMNSLFVFLDMLSRLNAVDFEIYDRTLKSYSKFAMPEVYMGYGKKTQGSKGIQYYICEDDILVDKVSSDLKDEFSNLNKLYGLADGVDSIIDMIEESEGKDPIIYLPYIYLYLADDELIEVMTSKGLISSLDYSYWKMFSKLCTHEKMQDIKLVVSQSAWENAMKDDWIKLWTGFSRIEDFGSFAPIIRKNINDKLVNDNLYIRDDEEGKSKKLPNLVLYADTENSFSIRTNIGSHRGLDRVFNRTYDEKMAQKLHTYLERLYNGNIVFME